MAVEGSGHVKVTVDVEINEPLMKVMEESMSKMPNMIKMLGEQQKKEQK